ncbi:MAG: POTRA domain-containing protein, partial [Microcystaceae cyanobacterium]
MIDGRNLGKWFQIWLQWIVAILTLSLTNGALRSEPIDLAQVPRETLPERPPPQNIVPLPSTPSPLPETPSQPAEPPLQIPAPASPSPTPEEPESVPGRLTVTEFYFTGNTVFPSKELGKIQVPLTEEPVAIAAIQDQTLSFPQLLQVAAQVANFYAQHGYRTSGAIIVIPKETQQRGKGKVEIKVIEGTLEQINVGLLDSQPPESTEKEYGRLGNYVRSRLKVNLDKPLNVDRLLEALQLLQLDPLIEMLSATLSTGSEQGKSVLDVGYRAADSFSVSIDLDNGSPPSVGSFERGITIREGNL